MNINKNVKIDKRIFIFFQAILVILCGIWYSTYKSKVNEISEIEIVDSDIINNKDIINNYDSFYTNSQGMIVSLNVNITGAVNNPGIYHLNTNNTFKDAIGAAGGFAKNADTELFKLDYLIFDAISIYVPQIGEDYDKEIIEYSKSGIPAIIYDEPKNGLININSAKAEELMELPGIGAKLADNIIKYRENVGEFNNIEDIKNVSKIGNKIFDEIKNLITVE